MGRWAEVPILEEVPLQGRSLLWRSGQWPPLGEMEGHPHLEMSLWEQRIQVPIWTHPHVRGRQVPT